MARNKEYDRDEVLDAATQVFWRKGFKGASVSDLIEATGLGKRSMYKEFESKEGLFKACINHYVQKPYLELGDILTQAPLGLDNIRAFFRNRAGYASTADCQGCMLVNSAIEKELIDAQAFELAQSYLRKAEEAIFNCLSAAQEKGEISPKKDCRAIAGMLATFAVGMTVEGKLGIDKDTLEKRIKVALSVVEEI